MILVGVTSMEHNSRVSRIHIGLVSVGRREGKSEISEHVRQAFKYPFCHGLHLNAEILPIFKESVGKSKANEVCELQLKCHHSRENRPSLSS